MVKVRKEATAKKRAADFIERVSGAAGCAASVEPGAGFVKALEKT